MKAKILSIFLVLTGLCNAQETIVLEDHFDDNKNEWFVGKENSYSAEIKNGKYIINRKSKEGASWFHRKLDVDPNTENFTVEVKMKQISGVDNYGYGLLWGMYSNNEDYQTVLVASNKFLRLANYYSEKNHPYLDWHENESVKKMKKDNVIKVVRSANIVTYYINGIQVYKDGGYSYFGSKFGFYISNKMEVEIDYIKVTKSPLIINYVENHDVEQENVKLSSKINTDDYDEMLPIVTADGMGLFCVRDESPVNIGGPDDNDIWYSEKDAHGEWEELIHFGPPLNNDGHNFVISVSPDNNKLFIANTYNSDGSSKGSGLSISKKTRFGWTVPTKVEVEDYKNDNDYVGFCIGSDNKTLIMSVERPGEGLGEKDLFVSFLKDDETWTKPMHLGNVVNSDLDDNTPFLAADNKTLYFSSKGHYGLGGNDVFVTKRLDDSWQKWSTPQNMGASINSANTELGFKLSAKGDYAYVSSSGNIHRIGNPSKPEAVVLVSGVVYNQATNKPMSADIVYYDLKENTELGVAISDPSTGAYKIVLPAGKNYSFLATKSNFYSISENVDLSALSEYSELSKDLYLSPIKKGEIIRLNNIFFEFNKADLKEESYSELDRLVEILKDNKKLKIEIGGHTDDKGSESYNLKLSKDRASSVVAYLVSKGISANRLTSKGYGESQPVVTNDSDENRAFNRRVEFKILED